MDRLVMSDIAGVGVLICLDRGVMTAVAAAAIVGMRMK